MVSIYVPELKKTFYSKVILNLKQTNKQRKKAQKQNNQKANLSYLSN